LSEIIFAVILGKSALVVDVSVGHFNFLVPANAWAISLLIVDDFGLKPTLPPEGEGFHDLIAERYGRTSAILILFGGMQ